MYENLYSYNEEVNGKSVWMILLPNFREDVTLFSGSEKIFSDGKITMRDKSADGYTKVYVSEDAQWVLEEERSSFMLFVTERTNEIKTNLGEEWNKEFNRILKKCKEEYYFKKKREIRLYFYDSDRDKLRICFENKPLWDVEKYEYCLERFHVTKCAIDRRFDKPQESCFILGRVRKTIGWKNSKLLDFIEPTNEIKLDFEKDEWDYGDTEYKEKISELQKKIYDLLEFYICHQYRALDISRINAYLGLKPGTPDYTAAVFKTKIIDALFRFGDTKKIRHLYDVLNNPQDCSDVKFELRLEKEVSECNPTKKFEVFFENGEMSYETAEWIYKNIDKCTDASGIYLGELHDRYNFY